MHSINKLSIKSVKLIWLNRLNLIAEYANNVKSMPVSSILVYNNFEIAVSINYKSDCILHSENNLILQSLFYFPKNIIKESIIYTNIKPCKFCLRKIFLFKIRKIIFLETNSSVLKKIKKHNLTNTIIKNFLLKFNSKS